jgi:hypothetical protein
VAAGRYHLIATRQQLAHELQTQAAIGAGNQTVVTIHGKTSRVMTLV